MWCQDNISSPGLLFWHRQEIKIFYIYNSIWYISDTMKYFSIQFLVWRNVGLYSPLWGESCISVWPWATPYYVFNLPHTSLICYSICSTESDSYSWSQSQAVLHKASILRIFQVHKHIFKKIWARPARVSVWIFTSFVLELISYLLLYIYFPGDYEMWCGASLHSLDPSNSI